MPIGSIVKLRRVLTVDGVPLNHRASESPGTKEREENAKKGAFGLVTQCSPIGQAAKQKGEVATQLAYSSTLKIQQVCSSKTSV